MDKLLVYPERMQRNLDRMGGLVHSQRVLLALTQAGLSREDAYGLVQSNAMKVWESDGALWLLELLKADPEVAAELPANELEAKFDLELSPQARRHDFRARVRRGLAAKHVLHPAEEVLRVRAFVAGLAVAELGEQILLLGGHLGRGFDQDPRNQVAAPAAVQNAHAGAAVAKRVARLDPGGMLNSILSPSTPGRRIEPPARRW